MKRRLTALTMALGFSIATAAFALDKMQDDKQTDTQAQDKKGTDHNMDDGHMGTDKMSKGKMNKKKKMSGDKMKDTCCGKAKDTSADKSTQPQQ